MKTKEHNIPKEVIEAGKRFVKESVFQKERALEDSRLKAIGAIEEYKEYKKSLEEFKERRSEVAKWLIRIGEIKAGDNLNNI